MSLKNSFFLLLICFALAVASYYAGKILKSGQTKLPEIYTQISPKEEIPTSSACQADYNQNLVVDKGDIENLLTRWKESEGISTLMTQIKNWGAVCD